MKLLSKCFVFLKPLFAFTGAITLGVIALGIYAVLRPETPPYIAQCQSHLKQLGLGMLLYVQDHEDRFPSAGKVTALVDNGWARRLTPYLRSAQLYRCPIDSFSQDTTPHSLHYTNYYFNGRLQNVKQTSLKDSAKIVLFGEGETASSDYACTALTLCTGLSINGPILYVPMRDQQRHIEGSNYAFADGHVKWFRPGKVSTHQGKNSSISFALR